ncbi:MAG TPA: M14 family metallopeptidase [Bryobacteraceae bacterium]|nr:M14 family metallopeptidase [Bryobacteraceae bacterium]
MRRLACVLAVTAALAIGAPATPESFFGHPMGADRSLLDWNRVVSYFQELASESNKIQVRELGRTTEDRAYVVAIISAPENLKQLDKYRTIQQRLADPRRTSDAEAEKLIEEGKTVVMITCSVHSTEVASTSTAVEYAYNLITKDTVKNRAILKDVILLLVPSQNPDGVDLVTRWYRQTLGTPFEGSNPPELYQKYVGHDNNRDWYMFSQVESRLAVGQLQNVWHPQIVYDVHQQGQNASRMFVPPWMDPVDPNIDPIIAQQCNAVGATMAADLTAAGKKGVAINAMYDFWTPARHYQAYHGGLRILSESASARLASPITVKPDQIQANALGYSPRERSWNYLEPWMGGTWRQRDIVDYQLIAFESLLYQAATRRADLLRGFWQVHKNAVNRTKPNAFVISSNQRDPGSTAKLLETLAFGMVEIERASAPFQANGKDYPAGSHVIRMNQPYSNYAKTLLERQDYPDLRLYPGGPPKRPYDVTAQTLPLLMGVSVDTIDQPFEVRASRVTKFEAPAGDTSAGNVYSWKAANAAWKQGRNVYRNSTGDFRLEQAGSDWKRVKQPRVGLYRSFMPSMDEGWTRWLLEEFGFAYTSVGNPEILAGNLRAKYDALIFPDQQTAILDNGYKAGSMPDNLVGGLGAAGADALKKFANEGGTVIFLNDSVDWGIERMGLGIKNVLAGVPNREFYSPGSLLNVKLNSKHPLNLGLPTDIAIWFEGSPAFELSGDRVQSVAEYPASNVLASGWLLGEKYIKNKHAVLDVPLGSGRVILFGMRPQYRAQSYQTFKMFFNSLVLAE